MSEPKKSLAEAIGSMAELGAVFAGEVQYIMDINIYQMYNKYLIFFYFLTFEKADCSIFTLSVGRLVGRSVDVTINFFNIYRHKSPL